MTGTQHLVTGLTIGVTLTMVYPEASIPILAGAMIGALLPDIDTKNSLINKITFMFGWILQKFVGHREITHDLGVFGVIATAFYLISYNRLFQGFWLTFLPCLFLGILSHLMLDGMTKEGIPIFFSDKRGKRYHLLPKFLRCKASGVVAWFYTIFMNVVSVYATFLFGIVIKATV